MKSKFTILSLLALSVNLHAQIGSGTTSFDPVKHGYKFANTFETEVINDLRFGGLCGGMVYSALDYYNRKKDIPMQTFRPAVKTPLFNYIYDRQQTSTLQNIDKWTELFVNPFGSRTNEFFNWGLQGFKGGRLQELKTEIDKGIPVPLGLFKPGNGGAGPHHQVLAIGYKGGRYKGDLGLYQTDLEISVYDPNYPNQTRTLKADPVNHIYFYKEDPGNKNDQWMTYFVDKKYSPRDPASVTNPVVTSDDMIKQVLVEIKTGGDDLRGGNDNLNITLTFKSGAPPQTYNNVNKGGRWINNYTETVPITLSAPVKKTDLKTVVFTTTFGGGIGGDNWNMDAVRVLVNGAEVTSKSGTHLYRFTGDNKRYILPMP